MNPCPCGHFDEPERQCTCSPGMVAKYQNRISGPLLDRIDIHLEAPRVPVQKLSTLDGGETSHTIRPRVENARMIQHARFASVNKPNVLVNGDMGPAEVQRFCPLNKGSLAMIRIAVERMGLRSARAYHRLLKLSRTIADLAGSEQVQQAYLAEALQYRARGL
jgi:magnesium chelatase family protein